MVVVSVLPLTGLVIVGAAGAVATLTVNVSAAEGAEMGPVAAACVAVTVWLALLKAVVGVKLQALLTTAAVPATGSIDLTPDGVAADAAAGNGRRRWSSYRCCR